MSRSRLFDQLIRVQRIARFCDAQGLTTSQGLERLEELEHERARQRPSRRDFLKAAAAGAAAVGALGAGLRPARAQTSRRVAIVGGGLAGLVCADQLARAGVVASIYEGNARLGGRCNSYRGFPGQVVERGGEMIDNLGKTMLGYAKELKLPLEDLNKQPGDVFYYFNGRRYSDADVVSEWRALVARARPDLQSLSKAPTALAFTPADAALDNTDLQTWLDTRASGLPLIQAVLASAYVSEYGREPVEQSSLNLLEFIHLDRRSEFNPYGASDERYHIIGGNDQIVSRLAARLPGSVTMGKFLVGLRMISTGEYELTFEDGTTERADAVVLTVPFSVLRGVALDPSLALPPAKLNAIQQLGYGYNCKTHVGFEGRPWARYNSNGSVYSDLPNLQNTWESDWTQGGAHTVLTDYAGGNRGQSLQFVPPPPTGGAFCFSCHTPGTFFPVHYAPTIDAQAESFLLDLDKVYPGAKAAASRRADGSPVIHRAHWLVQKYSRGSYTCYLPGQFTTVAGLEGTQVGRLYFAGEHADSFYEWQGFMEGAARSGVAAAKAILSDLKSGRL